MPEPEVTPTPETQPNVDPATPQPTPEEQSVAALEAARQATADEEAKRIAAERKIAELETEKRHTAFLDEVRDCARDANLAFYVPTRELVKLVSAEPGFDVNVQNGTYHIDGKPTDLDTVLRTYAARHANLIERSAEQMRADREAANGPKSKAELRTWKEKSDYIDKFGLRAYEALPLKAARNVPISQMTNEDYHELSWAEKSKIIDRVGERGLVEIMNRRRTS
jgi:hypothetical protein